MFGAGTIPDGFLECDGTNGTQNLQGYMVKGAGSGVAPRATGGSNTITPMAPLFETAEHLLADNEIPAHTHVYNDEVNANTMTGSIFTVGSTMGGPINRTTITTEPGGALTRTAHAHQNGSFSWTGYKDEAGASHNGALDIRPSCRAVKFVMRSA